jgi:Short C-terminal domain
MPQLTPEGQRVINGLAQQYQVSTEAVMSMLQAVIDGNGTMAQFNHPEFGGAGQWMRGGMTMVSDMFNHALKSRVEGLCSALAHLLSASPSQLTRPPQSQSQQGGPSASPGHRPSDPVSLFVPPAPGRSGLWWPDDLGAPSSTGAQNNVRYAHFAQARRLAIEANGHVTVYDTLDHHISGFSQQQSVGSSLSFSSQHGLVDVAQLPVITPDAISSDDRSQPAPVAAPESPATQASSAQPSAPEVDIFTAIEKLGALKARGLLTEEEFASKKADLLSRL